MGKRKRKDNSDDESHIRRKIRRLEKKLRRSKHEDRHHTDSDTSDQLSSDREQNITFDPRESDYLEEDDTVPRLASAVNRMNPPASTPDFMAPGPSTVPDPVPVCTPIVEPEQNSCVVPDEILDVLGEAKNPEQVLGEKIPSEIAERWGKILLDGLTKEQKESLLEKMLIPENFLLARAPKMNPEVSTILSESARNRDKRLEKAQNQLGSGIAGLVNLTRDLIHSELPKIEMIKKISEISQILLDLHYEETINRRKLVIPLLNKIFLNTTQEIKRETFLFGDKLGENIKNSKDIERSSQQIKKAILQPNFQRKLPMSGNVRYPPRPQNNSRTAAAVTSSRYYEQQSQAPPARRNTSSTRPRFTKPPPRPANKSRDRRRR